MAELQADFELLPRETLEAEMSLEQRSNIDATFEINIATKGDKGDTGPAGKDATINGQNTITLNGSDGISVTQDGQTTTISGAALMSLINGLATVARTGSYNDLLNKPTIGNATLTIQRNGTSAGTFTSNATQDKSINIQVPTTASDVGALPNTTTINDLTTPAQQSALNSGITSQKVSNYDSHISNTNIHVTSQDKTNWNSKQNALSETQLNAVNSGITSSLVSQITINKNDIGGINELIPEQASASNQLADKSFVNSSVATNTANFIGTFNSVADLEAYSGPLTNNDYAFVVVTDQYGNTAYDRYKYTTATTPASWVFEYELNNSSFTANQWAAINSGATETNIGQIATNTSDISDINTTIGGYGNIVTHDTNEFATAAQGGLADSAIQPGDNVSELVNDSGYITGITSLMVTTALGYTPYNATNPNGYQANVLEGVQVNGTDLTITSKKVNVLVPTKTSDLNNDSGFITSSDLSDYVAKSAGSQQTVQLNEGTGTTAFGVRSRSGSSYISFSGTGGWLGSYGVTSGKEPTFYNGSSYTLAYNIGSGTANGTIRANGADVAVTGLGSAAYTSSGDYATSAQGGKADSAIQGVQVNGTDLTPDANKKVNVVVPTVNNATLTVTLNGTSVGTFTANSASDVTIPVTDTTYSEFTGASSNADGTSGLVKKPVSGDQTKYLKGNGTWSQVAYSEISGTPTIPTSSDYWTVGTSGGNDSQTTYSKKLIYYKQNGAQDNGFRMIADSDESSAGSTGAWTGRCLIGNEKRTFLLGTARNSVSGTQSICGLGAHTWGSATSQTNAAWDNIYIQPDGSTAVYLGGNGWRGSSGWFRVLNNNSGSALYRVAINTGTNVSPAWKTVLPNNATGTNSILFTPSASTTNTVTYSTAVNSSVIGNYGTSYGYGASSAGYGVAIGYNAKTTASTAIQIGQGTNNTQNTMSVGLSSSLNVQLLDSTGVIPAGRLNIASSVSSSSTNDQMVGAKLFYDTVGNIETLLNNINSGS